MSTLDARFEGVQSYIGTRMNSKRIICIATLVAMLSGCNGIDNPEGDLKGIKLEDWPLTDCSTSTKPARDLVAYKLYQFLFTNKGADMIDESGYIAIRK